MFLHKAFVIFLTAQSEADTAGDRAERLAPLTSVHQQGATAAQERIVDWRWFLSDESLGMR